MEYPKNSLPWKSIAIDGYPSKEEYGPYPTVMVAMSCDEKPEYGKHVEQAELRYFGNDPTRPFWCKGKPLVPIENSAWHVTHWTPLVAGPED